MKRLLYIAAYLIGIKFGYKIGIAVGLFRWALTPYNN